MGRLRLTPADSGYLGFHPGRGRSALGGGSALGFHPGGGGSFGKQLTGYMVDSKLRLHGAASVNTGRFWGIWAFVASAAVR
jgi:hypothetical protein